MTLKIMAFNGDNHIKGLHGLTLCGENPRAYSGLYNHQIPFCPDCLSIVYNRQKVELSEALQRTAELEARMISLLAFFEFDEDEDHHYVRTYGTRSVLVSNELDTELRAVKATLEFGE